MWCQMQHRRGRHSLASSLSPPLSPLGMACLVPGPPCPLPLPLVSQHMPAAGQPPQATPGHQAPPEGRDLEGGQGVYAWGGSCSLGVDERFQPVVASGWAESEGRGSRIIRPNLLHRRDRAPWGRGAQRDTCQGASSQATEGPVGAGGQSGGQAGTAGPGEMHSDTERAVLLPRQGLSQVLPGLVLSLGTPTRPGPYSSHGAEGPSTERRKQTPAPDGEVRVCWPGHSWVTPPPRGVLVTLPDRCPSSCSPLAKEKHFWGCQSFHRKHI